MSEESKGQQNRKNIRMAVEHSLLKYCPNTYNRMANLIAYDFNLCPDTVKYSYLSMFIEAGILEYNHDNQLDLSAKVRRLQDNTSNKQQLQEETQKPEETSSIIDYARQREQEKLALQTELDKENELRNQLGEPKLSLAEWKRMRSEIRKNLPE